MHRSESHHHHLLSHAPCQLARAREKSGAAYQKKRKKLKEVPSCHHGGAHGPPLRRNWRSPIHHSLQMKTSPPQEQRHVVTKQTKAKTTKNIFFSVVSTSSFPNLSKGKKNRSTAHSFHSCFTSFHSFVFFTCFLSSLEGESLLATSLIDCSKHFPRIVKFPLFFPTLHSSFNEDFRR